MFQYKGFYNLASIPQIDLQRFRFEAKIDGVCDFCGETTNIGDTIHCFWFGTRSRRYAHPDCLNAKIAEALKDTDNPDGVDRSSSYNYLWAKQREMS